MNGDDLIRDHTRKYVVSGVFSLVAFGVALALPPSPARIDMMLWGLFFPLLGAVLTNFLPAGHKILCNADPETEDGTSSRFALVIGIVVIGLAALGNPITMLVLTVLDFPPNSFDTNHPGNPAINTSPVVGASLVIQSLLILLINFSANTTALIQTIVNAPWVHDARSPEETVRMVGTVEDPTPVIVDAKPAAFAIVTDTEAVPGSNPDIVVRKFQNEGTFMVRSGQTWVEIDPRGIYWSGPSNYTIQSLAPSGNKREISTNYLPLGAKVLVVGKLRPRQSSIYREVPYTLVATAKDPVIVLRTEDPEALLALYRTSLRLRRFCLIVTGAFILATLVVCVVGLPPLPEVHVPTGSGSD